MWSFRYSDFVFPSSFSPTCSSTFPVCLSLSLASSATFSSAELPLLSLWPLLHVLSYESWPLEANASQAASRVYMAAPIRPFDSLLKEKMPRRCKINTYIYIYIWFVLHGSALCWCVCVPVFVLENRSLICLNRYSLVTAGVTVLWLGTWFVLVLSTVLHGRFAAQHACVGTYLCVSVVLYHAGELRCKLGSKYTSAGKDDSFFWKHSCSCSPPAHLAWAFLRTAVARLVCWESEYFLELLPCPVVITLQRGRDREQNSSKRKTIIMHWLPVLKVTEAKQLQLVNHILQA